MSAVGDINSLRLEHGTPVSISRLVSTDAPAWHAAVEASRADLTRWERWPNEVSSPDEAMNVLLAYEEQWRSGRECHFALWMGGDLVGAVGMACQLEHRCAVLGYWVASRYWGRGIATWAASAIVDWAFRHLLVHRVEFMIRSDNIQSLRVAAKIGAVREGTARQRIHDGMNILDACQFAILAPEWHTNLGSDLATC